MKNSKTTRRLGLEIDTDLYALLHKFVSDSQLTDKRTSKTRFVCEAIREKLGRAESKKR